MRRLPIGAPVEGSFFIASDFVPYVHTQIQKRSFATSVVILEKI